MFPYQQLPIVSINIDNDVDELVYVARSSATVILSQQHAAAEAAAMLLFHV
jgi:hypothetical protein